MRVLFLLVLCSCLFFNPSFAQRASGDKVWEVVKSNDFTISGDGSAGNWKDTEWVTLPQRRKKGAEYLTQMKLLYSDSGMYCLFTCEDAVITATLKEDFLDLYTEDVVEAFFWTDEQVPLYFEYELSPLNYELLLMVPNSDGDFFGWRPWHYEGDRKTRHATQVQKQEGGERVISWTAEFFIPFSILKPLKNVPPQEGVQWRANFYRIDYDNGLSTWAWEPTEKSFHEYEKFGTILFR